MKQLPASVLKVLKDELIRLHDEASNEAYIAESQGLQSLDTKDEEAQGRDERAEVWRKTEVDKAEITIDHERARAAAAALQRIANGNYGICQDCGRPIARARLLALPIALRCAACQQAYEQCHGRR